MELQQEGYTSEKNRLQMESAQALYAQRVQEKEEHNVTDTSGFKVFFLLRSSVLFSEKLTSHSHAKHCCT